MVVDPPTKLGLEPKSVSHAPFKLVTSNTDGVHAQPMRTGALIWKGALGEVFFVGRAPSNAPVPVSRFPETFDPARDIVVDLFAGGGGASLGIPDDLGVHTGAAVDHVAVALQMFRRNSPWTRLYREDVRYLDRKYVSEGKRLALLWAFPTCIFLSPARARSYVIDPVVTNRTGTGRVIRGPMPQHEQVAKVGNAVAPPVAKAIVETLLDHEPLRMAA